jgi:hypothetical protein
MINAETVQFLVQHLTFFSIAEFQEWKKTTESRSFDVIYRPQLVKEFFASESCECRLQRHRILFKRDSLEVGFFFSNQFSAIFTVFRQFSDDFRRFSPFFVNFRMIFGDYHRFSSIFGWFSAIFTVFRQFSDGFRRFSPFLVNFGMIFVDEIGVFLAKTRGHFVDPQNLAQPLRKICLIWVY